MLFKHLTKYRKLLRVEQWYKNLFIFLPLLYLTKDNAGPLSKFIIGFFGLCLISSVTYIINDWLDRKKDRLHPTKKFRPLAMGTVQKKEMVLVITILLLIQVFIAMFMGSFYIIIVSSYFVLTNLYSLFLKKIPLLDLLLIIFNFILRSLAGIATVSNISAMLIPELFLFGLLLFLLTLKRRSDIKLLGAKAIKHKPVLRFYNKINSYILRYLGLIIILTSFYLLYLEGLSLYKIVSLTTLLFITSYILSKQPKLAIKPHYLFKLWYWDLLLIITIIILSI